MRSKMIIIVCLLFALSACVPGQSPRLKIENSGVGEAKVSELTAGDLNASCVCDIKTGQNTSQVTMVIANNGAEADRLMKVESDAAARVELRQGGGAEELSSLFPVDSIVIPAKRQVGFGPGQYYMILTGLKHDLRPGDKINLTLFFEKAGKLTAAVPVVAGK